MTTDSQTAQEKRQMPQDIPAPWYSVIRRLIRAISHKQDNCVVRSMAIVSISVLVDQEGTPVVWTEPQTKRLYPNVTKSELLALLDRFTDEN